MDLDSKIRAGAFEWLQKTTDIQGDVLDRALLERGFLFEGVRIPLVSPQGIFKPKQMELPLTISSTPESVYGDRPGDGDALWLYKYRGTDIHHPDNVGLRKVLQNKVPIIFFLGIVPGKYLVTWPVYILEDRPKELTFVIGFGVPESVLNVQWTGDEKDIKKLYSTTVIRARLHQRAFRVRVLHAYRNQCSLCKLKHQELLDAAHIIEDKEERGDPVITNGIALCKLHHAAFDKYLIGITPDYSIKVREDILEESDGPMLLHGLKNLNGNRIYLPSSKQNWPNREFLEIRFESFLGAI